MSGRPEILFPLFAELETLAGVGPKTVHQVDGHAVPIHIEGRVGLGLFLSIERGMHVRPPAGQDDSIQDFN